MTNDTIPHGQHHRHQEMDQHQLHALAVKPQVKKQARRRTHTSRPYQERLLNMAEARREIVTALKIHRASSTKQQSTFQPRQEPPLRLQQQRDEQKQQAQQAVAVAFHQDPSQAAVDEEASLAHTAMSYAAAASFASDPLCITPAARWIAAGSYCAPPPILRLPCDLTPPEPEPQLPPTAAAMVGLVELEHYQGDLERLVRSLPAQPLGLNLSFQGFGVAVDHDGAKVPPKDDCEDLFGSIPSPAASYSYSPPPAVETMATIHACGGHGHGSPSPLLSAADAENEKHSVIDATPALVPVLLDDGSGTEMMAQQASTGGETEGVEWTADVAAWWSKIFESGQRAPSNAEDDVQAAGSPAEWRWLCGNDDVVGAAAQGAVTGGVLATMVHPDVGEDDVTLPCIDCIGDDVQGWDGEWFSCS